MLLVKTRSTALLTILVCANLLLSPLCAGGNPPAQADAWKPEAPREELKPRFGTGSPGLSNGSPALEIISNGKSSVNGWWTKTLRVSPGKHYKFRTFSLAMNLEGDHNRCILSRIIWIDGDGKQAALPEYPRTSRETDEKGWSLMQGIYQAPPSAVTVKLELVFRWAAHGSAVFRDTSFTETVPPEPRDVTIAAIHFRPRNSSSARENLVKFSEFIRQAAEQNADIVCLPEGITLAGTGNNYLDSSEPVPGPTTEFLGEAARKHGLYIVANFYEKENEALYNTSVLLDRQGNLAGKYRKVSLPREEIEGGISPGDSFNVFETDFGTIGLMTCWDVFFPLPARALASRGAEIIFLPIWGGNINLAKARAIENQVYLVSSSYDMKTGIFDHEGNLIAEGTEENPLAIKTLDLNKRTLWPWLGDFKSRIPREKPPVKTGKVTSRAMTPSKQP